MPARRPRPPLAARVLQLPNVGDPATSRALDAIAEHLSQTAARTRARFEADLVVGTNKLTHGLGQIGRAHV